MPNGQLDIGTGIGQATVFNFDPAVQNFARIINDRNEKRQQELKDLSTEFGKVSPMGIRQPDRDLYNKKYMEVQALGRQKVNETDLYKKAMLQGKIDQGFQDLAEHVSVSKQRAAEYKSGMQFLADEKHRKQFTPDAVQKWLKSANLPYNNPDYISDLTELQRAPDMNEFYKRMDSLQKSVLGKAKANSTNEYQVIGGQKQQRQLDTYEADPRLYASALAHQYDLDEDMPAIMRQLYPQLYAQAKSDQEFKAMTVQQYMKDYPIEKDLKPGEWKNVGITPHERVEEAQGWTRIGIEKQREKRLEGKNASDFVENWLDGSDPQAVQTSFRALSRAFESHANYRKPLTNFSDDGKSVKFTVPASLKENPLYQPGLGIPKYIDSKPAYNVTLNRSNPQEFRAGLYEVIKNMGSVKQFEQYIGGRDTPPKEADPKDPLGILK